MPDNELTITDYKFSDLVDVKGFAKLLDSFFKGTGIPNGLIGESGEVISQAGWVNACAMFHRKNKESNKYCLESNLALMNDLRDGEVAHSLCKNGLLDYATPIVIEGHQLATLFLGQVLDTPPNLSFFDKHATKFDYDKEAYKKAILDVPIVSKEQMESLMECMVSMAQMLAASGLAKLRQNLLESDLHKSTTQLIQIEDILNFSPIGIGWSNIDGKIEYINHQFTNIFGYTLADLPDIETWYSKAYPDTEYKNNTILPWTKATKKAYQNGTTPPELESNVTCKNGAQRRILIRVSWVGDKRLVSFSDITDHWKSEQRNKAHDSMLEMIAKGSSLPDILHAIVLAIESEDSTSKCSILLLDTEGKHLLTGASLSLPKFYNNAINGIEIGEGVGSCGTAAYLGKRVVVEDIMTHRYWEKYTELAKKAHLGSCWSEPIISSNSKVLGTFAIYHEQQSRPNDSDIERINFAANLAAIAIENKNTQIELERLAYSDYLTGLENRRSFISHSEAELSRLKRYGGELSLIMFDIDRFKLINDTHGHNIGDLVLQNIAEVCRQNLRNIDIIGRIGGEEFAILLPETNVSKAMEVAERLCETMATQKISIEQDSILHYSSSFGVTSTHNANITIDALLKQADTALYEAKESGRNRVCLAESID